MATLSGGGSTMTQAEIVAALVGSTLTGLALGSTVTGVPLLALDTRDYGSGTDGDAVLDGVATFTGLTLAANVYTMTKSFAWRNLTINNGITLVPADYFFCVCGTMAGSGTVSAKGNNASGMTQGAGRGANYLGAISAGGGGGKSGVGAGNAGTSVTAALGGAGGAGGLAGASAGGTGGTVTGPASNIGSINTPPEMETAKSLNSAASVGILNSGGGGGGGGHAGAGGNTGAGGASGSRIRAAVAIHTFTGSWDASGGNGSAAIGGNNGGGGGGGGGDIHLTIGVATTTPTTTVAGGTGGALSGTGNNGVNGSAGSARVFIVGTLQ